MSQGRRPFRYLSAVVDRSAVGASRFPVAAAAILAFSLISNLLVGDVIDDDESVFRFLAALSGGGAVSVATALFLETRGWSRLASLGASAVAAVAAAALVLSSTPFLVDTPVLLTAALLAIPLAPFVGRGDARSFWLFSLWTGVGLVLSFLTVAVFCAGLAAILEMMRYLLGVGVPRRFDGHLYATAFTLVGPLFALGRIPSLDETRETFAQDDRLVRTVRPLFEWVQAPLIWVAAFILHAYVARILVTGEVPRNQIGWIVTVYSLLLLQLRIALDPFTDLAAVARFFVRYWSALLLVPTGLLAYALAVRIGAQGVTVERYVLALWCVALGLILAAQAIPRLRGDIRVFQGLVVLLLGLSTFGPFGVVAVVGRSQTARIATEFETALAEPVTLNAGAYERLNSRLRALDDVGQLGRVRSIVDADRAASPVWNSADISAGSVLGLLSEGVDPQGVTALQYVGIPPREVDVSGYDRLLLSVAAWERGVIAISSDGEGLRLDWNGVTDELVDLSAILDELPLRPNFEPAATSALSRSFDVVTRGGRHVGLRIEQLTTDPQRRITDATVTLMLRSDEWQAGEATPPR